MADIVWDTEDRYTLSLKQGHIRDNSLYLTAGLVAWMESEWGGVLTHIKTSTNVEAAEVTIFKALAEDPGAVPIRRTGALNTVLFNIWRPLRKLNLKVPADRQFNVKPFTREVVGVGTVFVFPLAQRESVPRNLRDEQEAESVSDVAAADAGLEGPGE